VLFPCLFAVSSISRPHVKVNDALSIRAADLLLGYRLAIGINLIIVSTSPTVLVL